MDIRHWFVSAMEKNQVCYIHRYAAWCSQAFEVLVNDSVVESATDGEGRITDFDNDQFIGMETAGCIEGDITLYSFEDEGNTGMCVLVGLLLCDAQ